jgi:hypothetical protein
MEDHYELLHTIYEIVKNDPQPERYACRPRELILRRFQEWSILHQQLQLLEKEELVILEQQDTLIVRVTAAGLDKVRAQNDVVRARRLKEK